jgi:hypothetical protein
MATATIASLDSCIGIASFFCDDFRRSRDDCLARLRLFDGAGLALGFAACVPQMPLDRFPSDKRNQRPRNPARYGVVSEELSDCRPRHWLPLRHFKT